MANTNHNLLYTVFNDPVTTGNIAIVKEEKVYLARGCSSEGCCDLEGSFICDIFIPDEPIENLSKRALERIKRINERFINGFKNDKKSIYDYCGSNYRGFHKNVFFCENCIKANIIVVETIDN